MVKNYEEDRHMVVIVDEVQAITNMKTLDQLRLLLNFQLNKRFLLTLILVGQPEFERKITNMPALANRINIRYCLGGLSLSQTGEYVAHRLRIAGSKNNIFTEEAIKTIHAYSRGIPREINNLCDLSLLVGFNQKLTSIGQEVINTLGRPWLGKRI